MTRGGRLVTRISDRAARRGKLALFAGAMTIGLASAVTPCPVHASPREAPLPPLPHMGPPLPKTTPVPQPDDGLSGGGFYLEANELVDDDQNHVVSAHGQVEARYQGRVVRANDVVYDTATGVVTANGDVTIINADGTLEFSQSAVLDRQLSVGVAMAFSSRLKDNISIAAASVARKSPDLTELSQAIFTPCPVCAKNPTPTWSIHASKVVEDKKRQIIYFRDAVIEIRGIPVMYLPALWEPDPDVKRKSGLLIPDINASSLRGLSYEQPYLQVICCRKTWWSARSSTPRSIRSSTSTGALPDDIDVRAATPTSRTSTRTATGSATQRRGSYLPRRPVRHRRQLNQFTAERALDLLIFDRYNVADPFIDRGLYAWMTGG